LIISYQGIIILDWFVIYGFFSMFFLLFLVVLFTLILTGLLRRYALSKNVMDIPNHRSAHITPTPRGGGVAFVVSILVSIPCMNWLGFLTPVGSLALMCAGVFVATLGSLDDHGYLNAGWRLLGHAVAALLALYWMQGFPTINFIFWTLPAGLWLNIFGFLYFIWLINLYNFMDGIDGLAASEAICVCTSAAFIYWLCGDSGLMALPLVLAASVAGFLLWNWPPARIFMGDAGSGFLGYILAVLSLQATHMYVQLFWSWLILLGVFIVDATYTIVRRACQGDKIYQAHSTHAYQRVSRRFGSHLSVTLAVILINLVWLLPLAILVGLQKLDGVLGLMIAYFPLLMLAIYLGSGKKS
jgi:Fuc2NAc and GlcNAc transferase